MTKKLSYSDYARFAQQSADELLRDCTVQVFRATGPGGQGVNTTDSAVRMTHVPTGVTVVSRDTRSQHRNRERCLEKLVETLRRRSRPPKHRIKTKVPARAKEQRLRQKRKRAEAKRLRRRVDPE